MKYNCDFCKKEFNRKPSAFNNKKNHFCSSICSNNYKKSINPWNKGLKFPSNKNPMFGKHHSPETIEKLRQKALNRSKEVNKKISETLKTKYASGEIVNPFICKKHSEATKNKMSINGKGKLLGYKRTEENKRNISLSVTGHYVSEETKNKIGKANSGKKASEQTKQKMRIAQFNYVKSICNITFPRIGHNEKQILDELERKIQLKILRQYEVKGFFIDGYIKEYNIAVEIDERLKNRPSDIERQQIIEDTLGCKFIRINDLD